MIKLTTDHHTLSYQGVNFAPMN